MCYMGEFKEIKGFEGKYQISNQGIVRNQYGHILTPYKTKHGYMKLDLWQDSKRKKFYIHRLVAEAFIPNPDNLPQVNHMDGNKENNVVENLEWCTAEGNVKHSIDNCLRTSLKAVDMYSLNGEFIKTFPSVAMASRKTGAIQGHIIGCCNGRYGYKTAGGYAWKYHKGVITNVLHE